MFQDLLAWFHLCIVAVVGFEETTYNISEAGGSQEVCVLISNPPQQQPLLIDILLIASTSTEDTTAGKIMMSDIDSSKSELWITDGSDFVVISEEFIEFFADNIPQDMPRRQCFEVFITDDDISEDTESFRVLLELDVFEVQEGIEVSPAETEICILDNDGNFYKYCNYIIHNSCSIRNECIACHWFHQHTL